jgi:predicted DNA-binding transcriptional regulator YafY
VTPLTADTTQVDTGANSLDELILYIALLGHRFEVQSPPELITRVGSLAATLAAALPSTG